MSIWFWLVIFQLKHFLADYPLQGRYMLGKFRPGWDFALPLASHCGVHALFTLGIALFINPSLWWLAGVDFVVHFLMDRLKAGPRWMGRWKSLTPHEHQFSLLSDDALGRSRIRGNTLFWWALGFDQMVHHCTHYGILWMLCREVI